MELYQQIRAYQFLCNLLAEQEGYNVDVKVSGVNGSGDNISA